VVARPIINVQEVLGTLRGKFSSDLQIMPFNAVQSIIGIWTMKERVYILRKHPGLEMLNVEESGQSVDNEDKEMEEEV
jgi:hypothetical protein